MLSMDIIAEIRRRHLISGESISAIARSLKLSRPTVRKHLHTVEPVAYQRKAQPVPRLGEYRTRLESWLETERSLPKSQRRTARRLFEGLQTEGYRGAYDSVQRFVKQWKSQHSGPAVTQAFVPLRFAAGEVCQFDWSHEQVELGGVVQTIKVAHFRLAFSRQMFVVAYPRETQEMVLDAHSHAGKVVSVRLTADQVRIVADGQCLAMHARCFGRDQLICDPWHYLPVLEKKPGALRNGAPFLAWELPASIQRVRDRLLKQPKGDRGFVELLLMAREVGLEPLEVACELAQEHGVITAAVVMNELRRLTAPNTPGHLSLPDHLQLQHEPLADCMRYDQLRRGAHVLH